MHLETLDMIADELAEKISTNTTKAEENLKDTGEVLIPTGEFSDVAKARNEQAKVETERFHWETALQMAQLEHEAKQAELEIELAKLNQALEIEKMRAENERNIELLKAANDQKVAETRAAAEKEAAEISKEASDTRSKRDLIGRILDFIGKVLVAILGLGACIYQASTILREEEEGNYVNTRSTSFWHKPRT